jgi:uncharacterized membrane protein
MSSDINGSPRPLTGLDGLFLNTNIVILIIFSVCCSFIAFILGLVGVLTCTDPRAKQNALIVTIIGALCGGALTAARLLGFGRF